ncbi:MAG TPA: HAMP domain-containing sensor histidine kinase [Acidimicrobiales bacterium]|nr:HAMP domain-containing sensor histidine kinase [Acidimicrobiales bacterium]
MTVARPRQPLSRPYVAKSGAALKPRRFGLRARATAAFVGGAAVISAALALSTFALAHHYLLAQREASATGETFADARLVKRDLVDAGARVGDVLPSITVGQGTTAYLYHAGNWYTGTVTVGAQGASPPPGLPRALVAMVSAGVPARQRVEVGGQPAVAVGVRLVGLDSDYFEVHSLSELARTLDIMALVLVVSAAATTLGGLLVGRWASGRMVRPLTATAEVAAAIAAGALDKRLPPTADPDLAGLADSFNEMVDALSRRMQRDARFASDVSHELRSPLTTVQAAVSLIASYRDRLGPDGQRALELLTSEVDRFSSMVQDLLEMSRFDAGAAPLDLEEVEFADLVVKTVSAYNDAAYNEPGTGGRILVTVTERAAGVWAAVDRRRVQRVLVNLLDNARSHGGGAVEVSVDAAAGEVTVTVDDAGPGVALSERQAVFERFYRGAAAGRRAASSGTGLGLALVAEHVRAHNGRVSVEDRPGGGARFVVALPVAPGRASEEGVGTRGGRARALARTSEGPK